MLDFHGNDSLLVFVLQPTTSQLAASQLAATQLIRSANEQLPRHRQPLKKRAVEISKNEKISPPRNKIAKVSGVGAYNGYNRQRGNIYYKPILYNLKIP